MTPAWVQLWLGVRLLGAGPDAAVSWDGPASCDGAAFEAELARLLRDSAVTVAVDASVRPSEAGWVLVTRFEAGPDRVGSRRFEAASCRTVSEAAALAVALAVDPAVLDRLDAQPEPEAEPEAEPVVPALAPAPEPAPIRPPETPWVAEAPADAAPGRRLAVGGAVGVAGFVEGLALPGLGGGVSVFGALRIGAGRFELDGSFRGPTAARARDPASIGADFSQWGLAARGVWAPTVGPLEFPVGLGFEGGQTIARTRGIPGAGTTFEPWLTPLAVAGVTWPAWPRVAFMVRAQVGVPLVRQRFNVIGVDPTQIHHIGPVQLRGLAGVELRFP